MRSTPRRHAVGRGTPAQPPCVSVGEPCRMTTVGTSFGLPGPFPGRVIEVHHPGCVVNDHVERQPVGDMVTRGICALTGASDAPEGWRAFFEPGDVVGIKVNPVGAPHAISSYALLHEVVAGL